MTFTVEYDKRSLTYAVKSLFLDRWNLVFPGMFVYLTIAALVVGTISFVVSGPVLTTAIFLLLGVLNPTTLLCAFALLRHRVLKLLGTTARIDLNDRFVRVESVLGEVELSWSSIIKIDEGEESILLFVSRGAAIVIPRASTPPDALDLLEQKRRALTFLKENGRSAE